ncbi:ankyrin, partial [Hyphopichia burtonii NRRL Y-1933]
EFSEQETLPADSPPRIRQGRKLLRKKDYDEYDQPLRKKQRNKKYILSDDESDDESTVFKEKEFSEDSKSSKSRSTSISKQDSARKSSTPGSSKSKGSYKVKRDSSGRSLLQRACKKGDLADVKRFISLGADANESDFGGFTCLHEAALSGHTDVVKYLIKNGADVNKQAIEAGDSETPLMDAAENKHIDTVKVLLDNGANADIHNADGYTALTKISHLHSDEEGYDEIIELLEKALEAQKGNSSDKAVPLAPSKIVEDPYEDYFLGLVKKKNSSSTIYKYSAQGFKEAAASDFLAHDYTLQSKPDILNLAARNGHVELVDILLGLNPGSYDINQENKVGLTALLSTVGLGNYEVVKFLISRGADPTKKRKKDGLNALDIAKYSAEYDPREVELLQGEILKSSNGPTTSEKTPANENAIIKEAHKDTTLSFKEEIPKESKKPEEKESEDFEKPVNSDVSDHEIEKQKENDFDEKDREDELSLNKKRKISSGNSDLNSTKKLKKVKSREFDKLKSQPSNVFAKDRTPEANEDPKRFKSREQSPTSVTPTQHSHRPSLESSRSSDRDITKKPLTQSPSPALSSASITSPVTAPAPAPAPLTKAQEEQRAKIAEEARIWQEKSEAKKKARKEFFIKAEKEKERKRKEDEEKRIEEQKKQEILEHEKRIKEAEEIAEANRQLEVKREQLKFKKCIENYPIGLRCIKFGIEHTLEELSKFVPLYVFKMNGEEYVIDLQLSLMTALSITELGEKANFSSKIEVSLENKSKTWILFYPMIGIDPSNPHLNLQREGHSKFKFLLLNFVKLSEAKSFLEKHYPKIVDLIWNKKFITPVDLGSMMPFNEVRNIQVDILTDKNDIVIDTESVQKTSFVPPKLRLRKDALRVIRKSNTPIW